MEAILGLLTLIHIKSFFYHITGLTRGLYFINMIKKKIKKKHTIEVEKHEMISLLENTSYEQKSVFGLFFPSKMDSWTIQLV